MGTVPIMAGHSAVSLRRNFWVSPKELKSIMDSAPNSTASFTFKSSMFKSLQSLEVPRFTLILVFSMEPMPFGFRHVWFLLAGMAIFPSAINFISSFSSNCSFSATSFISFVRIPFLAASICVVYVLCAVLVILYPPMNLRKKLASGLLPLQRSPSAIKASAN